MDKTKTFKLDHKGLQHWLSYTSDTYLNFLLSQLRPEKGELILDDGCGNGRFSVSIGQKGARVVALDVNRSLLKRATIKASEAMLSNQVEFVLADMQNLPFKSGTFERILCVHNLWYIPHYKAAATEMLRTLKKNGEIVLDHLNILNLRIFLAWVQYFASKISLRSPSPVFYRDPYSILSPFASLRTSVFSLMIGRGGHLYAVNGMNPFASRLIIECLK